MVYRRLIAFSLLLLIFLIPHITLAGSLDKLKLSKIKVPNVKIPGIEALTGEDDPVVSTGIADAQTEIAYLDNYSPKQPIPLDVLRPAKDGTFHLPPGAYEFDCQSYCLQPGTYGPSRGDGYLYAPLKGSKSGVISSILKRSANHPRIPQEDIQTLIWAVLARTKISDMSGESRAAASKLLTDDEIKSIQASALDVVPEDELDSVFSEVTEPVRRVLEAENDLRCKLTDSTATYDELADIAVLKGDHEKGKGSREVPAGRWSYDPQGCFVRYIPDGYTTTHIEIYVPELFTIERDDKSRIISVADRSGAKIELTYDDGVQPLVCSDDSRVTAYAFKSVKLIEHLPASKPENDRQRVWADTGWTFIGVPSGKASEVSEAKEFAGWEKRYVKAQKLAQGFEDAAYRTLKACGSNGASAKSASLQEMIDLSHLHTALCAIIGDEAASDIWTAHMLDRVTNAWQSSFQQRVSAVQVAALPSALIGLIGAVSPRGSDGPGGSGGGAGFSAGGGVAAPGDTAQQRLGQSGRPKRPCGGSGEGGDVGDALKRALKKNGIDVGDENLDIRESGFGDCAIIRFHVPLGNGNKPLPTLACAQQAIADGSASEGSMESPKKILFGSVQQCGDETMVTARTTNLETGEVTSGGRGSSEGTGNSSTESAANDALGGLGRL